MAPAATMTDDFRTDFTIRPNTMVKQGSAVAKLTLKNRLKAFNFQILVLLQIPARLIKHAHMVRRQLIKFYWFVLHGSLTAGSIHGMRKA